MSVTLPASNASEVARYAADGYLIVRGVFAADRVAELAVAAERVRERDDLIDAPGDVALFSGFTPHRSGPNQSDRSRRLLYLSFNAFSDGGERR